MANHQSAIKAHKQSIKKNANNTSRKSMIRTYIKKVEAAIAENNGQEAAKLFIQAQSKIMQSVKHNILKLNNASRKVSKLSTKLAKIS